MNYTCVFSNLPLRCCKLFPDNGRSVRSIVYIGSLKRRILKCAFSDEAGEKASFKVVRCGRAYRVIKQSFFDFLGVPKGA